MLLTFEVYFQVIKDFYKISGNVKKTKQRALTSQAIMRSGNHFLSKGNACITGLFLESAFDPTGS